MRCFISVDVGNETVRDNLMNVIHKLSDIEGVKPVSPENLHITLSFFGNVDSDNICDLRAEFREITDNVNTGTFTCRVSGLGVFPHMNYISIVWAGAEPENTFNELHNKYGEGITFTNEGNNGDFVPHITLSRVKYLNSPGKSRLQELVRERDPAFGAFEVTDVRLKESELTDDGPIYRDIEVCEL